MPDNLRALCLAVSVALLLIAALVTGKFRMTSDNRVRILAAGLALFVLPFLWDALEALN